jgi:Tfp pilus assembly protein PilX
LQWVDGGSLRDKLLSPILLTTLAIFVLVVVIGWAAARWALAPQYRRQSYERTGRMAQSLAEAAAVRARMDDCLARLDESERLE